MIRIFSLMFALTACKKVSPTNAMSAESQMLEGVWKSESGMTATIARDEVTSLVDYDDEVFVVLRSGWEEQGFSMHYEVPSTQYLVTFRITDISESTLQYAWNNTNPDGEEDNGTGYFERIE